MADNVDVTPGTGATIATDDVAGAQYQRVKVDLGGDGAASPLVRGQQSAANSLPVTLPSDQGTLAVSGPLTDTELRASAVPVSAASLPLPSGAATAAKQPALGTAGTASSDVITVQGVAGMTAVKVDGSAVTQPVSDGGGALTVDGTVTVQDGGGSITVDAASLPLPTGAATAAKQPALGAAGSASSDVLTVQGIAAMTALKVDGSAVTQPVSGTFWQATQPVSIAATVTVDSELPAAQTITGTGISVVQTAPVGAVMLTYNGTTWDAVQTGAADGVTSVGKVPGVQFGFNGSTFDRVRTITATMDQAATGIMAAGLVAQLDDTATQTVTENQVGVVRMSSRRALLVEGVASGTSVNTNVAAINGVTPLMGNGASGTGAQRVTIASDSTGVLATVTTLTNITNWGNIVDNAAFTDGTTRLLMGGYIFDEVAGTALTENDGAAARIDSKRAQVLVVEDETTRGQRQTVTADKSAKVVSKFLQVAASTLTRPANTTAYSANDAVSNNATAGSVTAQTATFSAVNDHPVTIDRVRVDTTDTGVAGKAFRVWLFNSDPTASTGVGGGDNAAWSQKKAGFIGSLSGVFRTFSDGCVGIMTPDEGQRILATPGSGAKTIWVLWQTLEAFTPSANSTTFIATLEGFQGAA